MSTPVPAWTPTTPIGRIGEHICPRRVETGCSITDDPIDRWRPDATCTYCGSIGEDLFFEVVEAGAELGPTDKSYKVYLIVPGRSFTKFYFQHLSDAGQKHFVALCNAKRLKIGVPGHFYVAPFFCHQVKAEAAGGDR